MSIFATLVIVFGILAGLTNVALGIVHREQIMLLLMRLLVALIGFGAAAGVIVAKSQGWHLPAGLRTSESTIYLFIALALFVGATLALPSTIERNFFPRPKEEMKTTKISTGKLATAPTAQSTGTPSGNIAGAPNVGIATKDEGWVN